MTATISSTPETPNATTPPRPDLDGRILWDIAYTDRGYTMSGLLREAQRRWPDVEDLVDVDDLRLAEILATL